MSGRRSGNPGHNYHVRAKVRTYTCVRKADSRDYIITGPRARQLGGYVFCLVSCPLGPGG